MKDRYHVALLRGQGMGLHATLEEAAGYKAGSPEYDRLKSNLQLRNISVHWIGNGEALVGERPAYSDLHELDAAITDAVGHRLMTTGATVDSLDDICD